MQRVKSSILWCIKPLKVNRPFGGNVSRAEGWAKRETSLKQVAGRIPPKHRYPRWCKQLQLNGKCLHPEGLIDYVYKRQEKCSLYFRRCWTWYGSVNPRVRQKRFALKHICTHSHDTRSCGVCLSKWRAWIDRNTWLRSQNGGTAV
jgi:hypothetical protein